MISGRRAAILVVAVTIGLPAMASPAAAVPTIPASAAQVAAAVVTDTGSVTGAEFVPALASANAAGVWDSALASFPTSGSSFGVLSSGDVSGVGSPGTFASTNNGGGNVRGNTDLDVAILRIDLSVPAGRNCLSVDFQFLSEEYPNFVGSSVNDAFVAELDTSTWTTEDSAIIAPDNFAFGPDGNVISVNSTGVAGMSAANGSGTAFDGSTDPNGGATQLLRASKPITPGAHSVYLSIFDQGDQVYDSAVFLDNLFLGTAPEGECQPGAQLPPPGIEKAADEPVSAPGGSNGYTITITNPNEDPTSVSSVTDELPPGFSYVPGSTSGDVTGDPSIDGGTLTWESFEPPLLTIPGGGSASFHFQVTVSDVAGEYLNEASLVSGEDVVSTGPTAGIVVQALQVPAVTKDADQASSPPGGTNGYTISVTNPNEGSATVDQITDTLPAGFSYVAGSTTGATSSDPTIDGQDLTWDGPFTVPATGSVSLHFAVTVSAIPGDYFNVASIVVGEDVESTEPTAPVTVQVPAPPPPPVLPCDPVTLLGTAGPDHLLGSAGPDLLRGLAGRDVLDALDGDDQLCGGEGGDYAYGRDGADMLRGEEGNDRLYGGPHVDALEGGPGHDALIAGRGADSIQAADGAKDCILTGRGADTVVADPGLDVVDPARGCRPGFWL